MYTHESLYTYLPGNMDKNHETLESHGSVNENLWILKGLLLLLLLTVSRLNTSLKLQSEIWKVGGQRNM